MSSPATPVVSDGPQQSTEQKVLEAISEAAAVATSIASKFGHNTIAGAVQGYSSLAPVFAGIFDAIRALVAHGKSNK